MTASWGPESILWDVILFLDCQLSNLPLLFCSCCNCLEATRECPFGKAELVRGRVGFSLSCPSAACEISRRGPQWPRHPCTPSLDHPVFWLLGLVKPESLMALSEGCVPHIKQKDSLLVYFHTHVIKSCISRDGKVYWHSSWVPEDWLGKDRPRGTSASAGTMPYNPSCKPLNFHFKTS